MSVNKVILLGRLGQDPELKYTPNGSAVCSFSLATSENWVDKGGQKQERTEWHRIVVWGKLGELCNQYLAKGRQCFLEGRIQTRSWDDKEGQKRYMTEINATTVQFLGANSERGAQTSASDRPNQRPEGKRDDSNSTNNGPAANNGGGVLDRDYQMNPDATFTADDIPF
ncbi:MAG: single-stranded DNA-binding protein [Bdellovibrionales bacterium GWA2_49_15]|nr:MAG: single-stranded DNA-binding protein [Bdellovibrionales bacterium GWA2_49_15]